MHLIERADYPRIAPLFHDMDHHLPVVAALNGDIPAEIYAGTAADPQVGLISVHDRRLYLAARGPVGELAREVRALLAENLYPRARAAGAEAFSLAFSPAAWDSVLASVLLESRLFGRPPVRTVRQSYEFRTGNPLPRRVLPPGFTLRNADRELLDDDRVTGLAALREEMCSERGSVDDFLADSFGICPVHESGALAGWCLSEYNTGERCEVGIATLEPYQRQGLASAVGSAFLELAESRGVTRVGWHCYVANAASAATARSIGFQKVEDYPAVVAWY